MYGRCPDASRDMELRHHVHHHDQGVPISSGDTKPQDAARQEDALVKVVLFKARPVNVWATLRRGRTPCCPRRHSRNKKGSRRRWGCTLQREMFGRPSRKQHGVNKSLLRCRLRCNRFGHLAMKVFSVGGGRQCGLRRMARVLCSEGSTQWEHPAHHPGLCAPRRTCSKLHVHAVICQCRS